MKTLGFIAFFLLTFMVVGLIGCTPVEDHPSILDGNTTNIELPYEPNKDIEEVDLGVNNSYSWEYRSLNFSADIILFDTKNQFFADADVPGDVTTDDFYYTLVNHEEQDDAINQLIEDLDVYYDDEELARLALFFISNLKYAEATGEWAFAYQTLYEYQGVCSDKTILAAAVLDNMGYDIVIFDFEDVNHMALGIKCQKEYAFWEDYCIVDVTEGHRFITDDNIYFESKDMMLGQPSDVFDVSENTKVFDASWDYKQSNDLELYFQQYTNLTTILRDGAIELQLASEDLQIYRSELEGYYPSKQDYEEAREYYDEYVILFEEAEAYWIQLYEEREYASAWMDAYEEYYLVDLYTPESIGAEPLK